MVVKFRAAIVSLVLIFNVTGLSHAAVELTKENGDRLQQKLDALQRNAATIPVSARQTSASQNEVNSYLTFNLREKMPAGLIEPYVTVIGDGRIAGRIFMDMDEFNRRRRSRGLIDPLNFLSGKVPVTATGTLRTENGQGRFTLASAEIQGVPLPKPILQEIVSFFSRTRDNPNGFDMDKPFNLPVKIRQVFLNREKVTVVQ